MTHDSGTIPSPGHVAQVTPSLDDASCCPPEVSSSEAPSLASMMGWSSLSLLTVAELVSHPVITSESASISWLGCMAWVDGL
jgi:hypothetical protein